MCLLVVGWRCVAGLPLVVAANRDERHDRAASPVARRPGDPRVLAGRDEEAGGTWLAVNERGVVAGLTNQPSPSGHDPSKRSRGALPLLLSAHEAVPLAIEAFATLVDPGAFNPCSLLAGDRDALFALELAGAGAVGVRRLGPGWHVLENQPYGTPTAKTRRVERGLVPLAHAATEDDLARGLARLLADHEPAGQAVGGPAPVRPATGAACVHDVGYGTRSSTIVLVGERRDDLPRVLAAEGPPCTTPFVDVSARWG